MQNVSMLACHELMGFMNPDLASDILGFAFENDRELYQATLAAVAEAKRVRPVYLQKKPKPERHRAMLQILTRSSMEMAAGNLVRGWLLKKHNPMLADFLDTLEIPHKDGVVDDLPATMDEEKIRMAIDALLSKYPHETVAVYLHAFNRMNDEEWSSLSRLLNSDARLQLGA